MSVEAVHLFLNPTAGRGRAGKREPRIRALLNDCKLPVEVHLSQAVGDLEEQVRSQVGAGARHVVVAGGDGSVHEASNGIMRAGGTASLGVIPTGTGNDFAKACDIPLDWERATTMLAARIASGEAGRVIDVGRVNDRYFVNALGIGFDANVTQVARAYRLPIGDLVYLFAVFRCMMDGIATPRVRIFADASLWDGPLTLASIANGAWEGGMFHIAPMARNDDGQFDLLVAAPVSPLRILSLLPALMSGKHVHEKEITHALVTELRVEADEPVLSHLDGEMQPAQQRFEVSLLARALRML